MEPWEILILPTLVGADFSYNHFQGENFPPAINQMKSLKWLKLCKAKLNRVPDKFAEKLDKLEKLNLSHNDLASLIELVCLRNLKFLNCRRNNINGDDVPVELFNITTLTVLDLSHNNLSVIPKNLEVCKSLKVLNLSHNIIKNIKEQLFIHLTGLLHLDLSNNKLKTVPPQLGRLLNLKTLILSNNPLEESKMRQIERLKSLQILHLSNTQRNNNNMPINLGDLTNLVELNLSFNQLVKVPDDLTCLKELIRLNLSENLIENMPNEFGHWWPKLEILNLSSNKLEIIPPSLCQLCNLRRLYLNDNQLTFKGLPPTLSKLNQLEIFMAARNNLKSIPESIFRCGRLKKLILTSNKLITLSDTIHLLSDLELELSDNPDLIMPPKPVTESAKNSEFYNIDFSLSTQRRLADPDSSELPPQPTSITKDPIARKLRLRTRAKDEVEESNQAKVLKGMKDFIMERDNAATLDPDLRPRKWDEILERPPIDYSDLFDETTGQIQGLTIWEIVDFYPVLIDPNLYGKFYEGDCYIILNTQVDENLSLNWSIFYWIGSDSSIDKKACSAIHAVSLRNHLNARCRTIREEQGEESDEFVALFPDVKKPLPGSRTESGLLQIQETQYAKRMYRLHEVVGGNRQLHLETVELSSNSLDSRFVFLIYAGYKIFIWSGMKSKKTTRQKACFVGEKLNKEERKNKAELIFCDQGDEPPELIELLELTDKLPKEPFKTIDLSDDFEVDNYQPLRPVLYRFSPESLELLQIDFKTDNLSTKFLVTTSVYILDCLTDVFVWWGRKSSRHARLLALTLGQDLYSMLKRPRFATISHCLQGTEPLLLKTKFRDWDDIIAVDYTRTAESVSKTGANLSRWMKEQKVKIDIASLFAPRASLTEEDASNLGSIIEMWNAESQLIEACIFARGKEPVRLHPREFGHFYTDECYVFLFRYFEFQDDAASSTDEKPSEDDEEVRLPNGVANGHSNGSSTPMNEEDYKYVAYFWQGRQASKMGWLTFTFTLQKKYEAFYSDKLEVVQMHQQQENIKFLSHFEQNFIIHRGKRIGNHSNLSLPREPIGLYHLRSNGNPLTLRCIEIDAESNKLNSGFCYILRMRDAPRSDDEYLCDTSHLPEIESGIRTTLFVWIGSKSNSHEAAIAEDIAKKKFKIGAGTDGTNALGVSIIFEGEEPVEFWSALGGKEDYDTDSSFMQYTRLFRCSNDQGFFSVSEKCLDFCQDDLSDDDIMILDNGSQVFLWIGPKSSEVEVKLAYKSAQVYVQNLLNQSKSRQLMLTFKGKESKKFTKCFHAWSSHKIVKDPRGDEAKFLRQAFEAEQGTSQA